MPLSWRFQLPGVKELRRFHSRFIRGGLFVRTDEYPTDEIELYKKGANAMQVGGRHYKQLPIEPWDYIGANGLGFFEGNIIKYITRAAKTRNRDDLLKAQHYLAKLLEITPNEPEQRAPKREPIVSGDRAEEEITAIERRSVRAVEKPERETS
jgi:Protein of unknwon function (DUF3310)